MKSNLETTPVEKEVNVQRFRNLVEKAISPICILKGEDMVLELANQPLFEVWNVNEEAIGKSLAEILPEVKDSPIMGWLLDVYHKGVTLKLSEIPFQFIRKTGEKETLYFNFNYQPYRELDETISGVIAQATDITEQVNARKKIEESEQKIRNLIAQAPVAMCLYKGSQFIISIINKKMLGIWRKELDMVINKSVFEAMPDAKGQGFEDLLQNVYSTGESFSANEISINLLRNEINEKIYVNLLYEPYRESDGTITGIVEVANDVTEQVLNRQKVEQSEKKFEAAIIAVEGIIWTNNAIGEMEGEQSGWANLTGQRFEEYQGYGWTKAVHPEDAQPTVDAWNIAVANLSTFVFEHRVKTKQGGYKLFSIKAVPVFDIDGTIQKWVGVHTDITALREATRQLTESEVQFSTLANNIQNLAWMADGDGYIFWYNQRWYEYTGTTLEEMKGWGWEKVHHPEHIDSVVEFVKVAWQKNEPFEMTFPLRSADGKYRRFLTRVFPVNDAEGKILRWVGTNTDIEEQKTLSEQLEEKVNERTTELHEKNVQLEKMNKELHSFAYISSHDLQEPLRKIQTFATLITEKEENNLSDNGKNMFSRMQDAARRMQRLIEDLLTYSRTNSEERKFENTDLNKIIEEVKEDLHEELNQKHAKIEANELCYASIIPFQFRQLMHNLIGNSLKFSNSEHPPHIKITSETAKGIKFNNEKLLPQNKYCHITVSDNGIGFEQQYNEKIFEVFQRLHGKEQYNGTGIGLSIVKKIVENHNGIITANGNPDKGATFEIYIPST